MAGRAVQGMLPGQTAFHMEVLALHLFSRASLRQLDPRRLVDGSDTLQEWLPLSYLCHVNCCYRHAHIRLSAGLNHVLQSASFTL